MPSALYGSCILSVYRFEARIRESSLRDLYSPKVVQERETKQGPMPTFKVGDNGVGTVFQPIRDTTGSGGSDGQEGRGGKTWGKTKLNIRGITGTNHWENYLSKLIKNRPPQQMSLCLLILAS